MITIPTAPAAHVVFDILSWTAAASLGAALNRWRLKESLNRVAHQTGPGYFAAIAIGAVPGAWLAGSLNTLRQAAATLSHSVAGALAGAIVGVELYKRARGMRNSTGTIFVGPFALGIVIGRLGCFFAGLPDDTYGTETALPWGVNFGDGISRHPVQLYESLSMALFLAIYLQALRARRSWAYRRSFYVLTAWYGAQRFLWELVKPYPKLIGPFNVFHLICAALILYGCTYFLRDLRHPAEI